MADKAEYRVREHFTVVHDDKLHEGGAVLSLTAEEFADHAHKLEPAEAEAEADLAPAPPIEPDNEFAAEVEEEGAE